MQIVSEQAELCRELPEIVGNADYADFEYRGFSRRLAESELLRWFCGIARIDRMHIPSKSALHRYEQMVDEEDVRRLVNQLNVILSKSTDSGDAPLGLVSDRLGFASRRGAHVDEVGSVDSR